MYYIMTGNRFNQILVFQQRNDAVKWLRKATYHTEEQIQNEIHEAVTYDGKMYNIFPQ